MRLPRLVPCLAFALVLGGAAAPAHADPTATVTLTWTTPGDDSLSGLATRYDLRYAAAPLGEANFPLAVSVPGLPPPAPPGNSQTVTISNLTPNTTYYFAIKTADERGNWSAISNIVVKPAGTVGVAEQLGALDFSVPYPNPARSRTRFSFSMPRAGHVEVHAFDVQGRKVRTLWSGARQAGQAELDWDLADDDGRPLGAGVYLVRARFGGTSFNRRVVVVK